MSRVDLHDTRPVLVYVHVLGLEQGPRRWAKVRRLNGTGEPIGEVETLSARACREVAAGILEVGERLFIRVAPWAATAAGWSC
jgi:hypothetical protein